MHSNLSLGSKHMGVISIGAKWLQARSCNDHHCLSSAQFAQSNKHVGCFMLYIGSLLYVPGHSQVPAQWCETFQAFEKARFSRLMAPLEAEAADHFNHLDFKKTRLVQNRLSTDLAQ